MTLNIPRLRTAWNEIGGLLAPITNAEELSQATENLEHLLDEIGEHAEHPLAGLAHLLIERVTAYEAQMFPIPDADPAEMLAFCLEQRQVKQEEVAAGTGIAQSVLSRLLNRKRPFTADHARSLGAFFKTNPSVFL